MFNNPPYKTTHNDFFVLIKLFGPSIQIGLEDPFAGLSIPEKDALRKDSLRRLDEQKVIFYPQLGNPPQLKDKNLAKILEIIAHPKHSVLISSEVDHPETRTYHYSDNEDVVSVQQENKDVVINTCSAEQVFQYITSKLGFSENDQSSRRCDHIELDEKLVNQVKELFLKNEVKSALDLLKDAGVNESLVEPLADALCKPDINLGLVVFPNRNRSDSPIKPLGILRKEDYLWTVEASNLDNHTAIIKCVSKQKLIDRIHSILPQLSGDRTMKRLIIKIKFDDKVKIEKFEIPAEQPLENIASNLARGLNLEEKLGGGKNFWFESETGILDMHKTLDQLGFKNGALLHFKNGKSIPEFKPKGPKPYNGEFLNSKP